jgi:D-alanyl-D-alanine carboxypeptidase/D-alanyl-D-alanine-endopeptidase (penicillin-binding protein 4)
VLRRSRQLIVSAVASLCALAVHAADPLPRDVAATLAGSGLPLSSFGFYVEPIDGALDDAVAPMAALNAERSFLLASTTKLVTSLAALDLLGVTHRWELRAVATGPVVQGRLNGDLVIEGGDSGLTPAELTRWFAQMRREGLVEVRGRIVLDRVAVLHEDAAAAEEALPDAPAEAREFNRGALAVAVQPSHGARAVVSLRPQPLDVAVVNEVFMGGGCNAWAQWRDPRQGGPTTLLVRGRWDASCGSRDVAWMRPPALLKFAPQVALLPPTLSTPRLVAQLWADTGGKLGRGVVETRRGPRPIAKVALREGWTSQLATPLPEVIREMNKTSNNAAARHLLLALSASGTPAKEALHSAQARVHDWLLGQGLADDDIRIDVGSGQSHQERGKPRALVQLLAKAWRASGAKALLDSLPIAGVDGTLSRRMRHGAATGQAYLKTGTLRDTRALAGYVRGASGKMYAVVALVNHPSAARATPALDQLIEWIAVNG